MKFLSALFVVLLVAVSAFAQDDKDRPVVDVNRAYEEYGRKNYDEVLLMVEATKAAKQMTTKWLYLEGITLLRLGRYKEAEASLDTFARKMDSAGTPSARGYYFLGLSYFYQGQYQKSLNAFQISQDVSQDVILDRSLDAQIDKSIRFRDYYDSHKPGTFAMFVGYEAHNNVLNLSSTSVDKSLNGHVFNYGLSLGYRPVDKMNFVLEPTAVVIDRYTLDKSFQADSTLQSLDVLQAGISLPVSFYFGDNRGMQYNISLNGFSTYLPVSSSNRDLYLSTVFLKLRTIFDVSQKMSMDISLIGGSDKGYTHTTEDDDLSGSRGEMTVVLKQLLNNERTEMLTYSLGGAVKNSTGINSRYQRGRLSVGYQFPSFAETNSSVDLAYEYLSYPDKTITRKDNKGELDYTISQTLTPSSTLNYSLGATVNTSDNEVYKYDDYYLGIQYVFVIGF